MNKALRVKNWDKHETAESRKINRVAYVHVPNKHDGKGFARIAMHKQSCRVFAGWMLILQVASKMPQRGLLVDEDGALDVDDLAAMTRFDAATFEVAIEALTDPKIGWLEWVDMPDKLITSGRTKDEIEVANLPANQDAIPKRPDVSGCDPDSSRRVRTIQNRTEQNRRTPPNPPAGGNPPLPPGLDNPDFAAAWKDWQRHRAEIRKPLRPTMAKAQLGKLAEWGPSRSVAAIRHTIAMGWQGLREPDPQQRTGANENDHTKGW